MEISKGYRLLFECVECKKSKKTKIVTSKRDMIIHLIKVHNYEA